jgi:glycosyltransferase involved in cell wall biosynthesis
VEDWGRAAIHFLSDVTWNVPLQKRFKCPSYHYAPAGSSALRRLYLALGRAIAGNSRREPAAHDLFVANSRWNAEISSEFCKREPAVICPAVPGALASVPWEERDSAFVCLGRIAPEKQVERAIRIIEQVRQAGHPVRLHLIGGSDDGCYAQEIRALCEARAEWIEQHGALYGERKFELLSGCRYGISSCECEAFGIATAEMMKAGLIPFVPRTGGQSEVVQQEALVYGGVQEAVLKIRTVLNAESRQADLQTAMLSRGEEFRPEAFCRAVQELVAKELRALDCERNDTTPCR